MNEFLTNYGLWLVIGLIIVITLVYLVSGKKSGDSIDVAPTVETPAAASDMAPPPIAVTPPPPVPTAVDPLPVTPPPVAEEIARVVTSAAPAPVVPVAPASSGGADNLLKLKGVGPKLAALLGELGVTSFAQIAAWTDTDLAAVDAKLGNFKGRPVRDHWVDQAKYLAAGDIAGFEAKYGKL
ncbi:MAG: hypothetical protein ACSLE1_17860 [Sphingobium sp.]